ncbi:MAG TPA: AraC family transcriptional regulator [Arachidicoccus sp.]|nr:AraC family transcriptional regulator [Arachidicoccus sp.]
MVLHIKNMVCPRCVQAVQALLLKNHITGASVELGAANIPAELSSVTLSLLSDELNSIGFEIINDQKGRLIESIKNTAIQLARQSGGDKPERNLSQILSGKLHYEYNYLSALFSEAEGQTIEKYFIAQKIEFVKELLVYDELTLNQIAFNLGYSSTAHLSNQFKKVTGLTPSYFRKIKQQKRKFLTDL